MDLEDLTYKIRGVVFEVFKELGPGLLERIYEKALLHEFADQKIKAISQVAVPVFYKRKNLKLDLRLDILIEDAIVLEIKSVESLHNVHKKQLLTYLKLSEKKLGFLINFNSAFLVEKESIIRIVNGL